MTCLMVCFSVLLIYVHLCVDVCDVTMDPDNLLLHLQKGNSRKNKKWDASIHWDLLDLSYIRYCKIMNKIKKHTFQYYEGPYPPHAGYALFESKTWRQKVADHPFKNLPFMVLFPANWVENMSQEWKKPANVMEWKSVRVMLPGSAVLWHAQDHRWLNSGHKGYPKHLWFMAFCH